MCICKVGEHWIEEYKMETYTVGPCPLGVYKIIAKVHVALGTWHLLELCVSKHIEHWGHMGNS